MGQYMTDTGFKGRTLAEVYASLETRLKARLGAELDTDPEGATGNVMTAFAVGLAEPWDGLREVVASLDPNTASAAALDTCLALSGTSPRYVAAPSTVSVTCYTDAAHAPLSLPAGRQVRRVRGSLVFSLASALTVTTAACRDIVLTLADLTAGTVSITLSFGTFTTPNIVGNVPGTLQALVNAINASGARGLAEASYIAVGAGAPGSGVGGPALRIFNEITDFAVTSFAKLALARVGSAGQFVCGTTGPSTASVGEITEIVNTEPGWLAVYNHSAASPGRDDESDEAARLRRERSFGVSAGTNVAIAKAVADIAGVSSCRCVSNRTDSVDDAGRPAHCVETVVLGGEGQDQLIAETIWYSGPGGIQFFGNVNVTITDENGDEQVVGFTRPTELAIWLQVSYEKIVGVPFAGEDAIREAILAWAATEFTVGAAVYPRRAQGAVADLSGVASITVKASLVNSGYSENRLNVDSRKYASVTPERVVFA